MVQAYVGGIAARSENYMRRHWDHAKGFIDDAGREEARRREEAAWVQAQADAGLGPVGPALVRWEDLLRLLADHCSGIEAGALTRTFETNTFHRALRFTGTPELASEPDDVVAEVRPAGAATGDGSQRGAGWILTLPSPHDAVARRQASDGEVPAAALCTAVGGILNRIAATALDQGAVRIRFHDPSILYQPDPDVDAFRAGLAAAGRGIEASCILHLTQGDPFDRPAVLQANPLRGLSIEDPGRPAPDGLRLDAGTELSVAAVRGEQSLLEDPAAVRQRAEAVATDLGVPLWGVTNGWDLDHVPRAIALEKLAILAQAARTTDAGPAEREVAA